MVSNRGSALRLSACGLNGFTLGALLKLEATLEEIRTDGAYSGRRQPRDAGSGGALRRIVTKGAAEDISPPSQPGR